VGKRSDRKAAEGMDNRVSSGNGTGLTMAMDNLGFRSGQVTMMITSTMMVQLRWSTIVHDHHASGKDDRGLHDALNSGAMV